MSKGGTKGVYDFLQHPSSELLIKNLLDNLRQNLKKILQLHMNLVPQEELEQCIHMYFPSINLIQNVILCLLSCNDDSLEVSSILCKHDLLTIVQ